MWVLVRKQAEHIFANHGLTENIAFRSTAEDTATIQNFKFDKRTENLKNFKFHNGTENLENFKSDKGTENFKTLNLITGRKT